MISLKGLDKAEVLAVLYNASRPQGMGFMHYDSKPMTKEEASALLEKTTYFDYLKGRVMKVELKGDELDPWGYDRDNGQGAAERAISVLKATKEVTPPTVQAAHRLGVAEAAVRAEEMMAAQSSVGDGIVRLTLDDVKDVLAPKVEEAVKSAK